MLIVVHVAITVVHVFKFTGITFLLTYTNVVTNLLPNLEITIVQKNFITFVHVLKLTFI